MEKIKDFDPDKLIGWTTTDKLIPNGKIATFKRKPREEGYYCPHVLELSKTLSLIYDTIKQ
jgi:hypothetical protein